jgi:hypothetical protein
MLNPPTSIVSPKAAEAADSGIGARTNSPLLISVPEARRHFGSLGTTAFYSAVKRYDIRLVKLGGRSLVPMAEIERVVAQLIAERSTEGGQKARVLAAQSVAARRRRRGDTPP